MKNKRGYVYFISDVVGHIKIGVSEDPKTRIKQLQTGTIHPLRIVHLIRTKTMKDAYKVEALLHKKLKENCVEGEWFEEKPVMKLLKKRRIILDGYRVRGMGSGIAKKIFRLAAVLIVIAAYMYLTKVIGW